jgi:hypothetical protein
VVNRETPLRLHKGYEFSKKIQKNSKNTQQKHKNRRALPHLADLLIRDRDDVFD